MTGTVFITDASSGFGAAAAERFAREGWQVVMVARRQDRLDELKQSMPHPDRIHTVVLDVRDGDAVTNAVAELPDPFSGINILVNNAGLALGMEGADQAVMDLSLIHI